MTAYAPEDPRQTDWAGYRRMRRAALQRWLANNRPDYLVLDPADRAGLEPLIVGGQRDGCANPGACRSHLAGLCRECAAILASATKARAA